jgi:hypothetical protein
MRRPQEKKPHLPSVSTSPGLEVTVPSIYCDLLVERLLKIAEDAGWKPSYEDADDDIYLLRRDGDAAQVRAQGGKVLIDASDSRQAEFAALVARVRDHMVKEIAGIAITTASPEQAPETSSIG